MSYYIDVLKKYATFEGRARREEYWMFSLFQLIFMTVAIITDNIIDKGDIVRIVYGLATFLPNLAVTVRRLHDIGKSGIWCLVGLIPLIESIWLIILMCLDGEIDINEYGEDPKMVCSE